MKVIGIDPGLSGGVCVISTDESRTSWHIQTCMPMPTTEWHGSKIVCLLDIDRMLFPDSKVFIEQAWARPPVSKKKGDQNIASVRSSTTSMQNYGRILGLMEFQAYTHTVVSPMAWMKRLGLKSENDENGKRTKAANIAMAKSLFPDQSWLPTERCRKPHDGMVDAALIAYYGLMHGGKS